MESLPVSYNFVWNRNQIYYRYGLSKEEFDSMLSNQDNKCLICDRKFNTETKELTPHVDHCHVTNKVRALLCQTCNAGLGQFRDEAQLLLKAAKYLEDRK